MVAEEKGNRRFFKTTSNIIKLNQQNNQFSEYTLYSNNLNHTGIYRLKNFSYCLWDIKDNQSLHFMGDKIEPQKNFSKKM